jgi:tRNA pseudouridine38-40 synthase
MRRCLSRLVGRHDFRAFGEELGDLKNAVRVVNRAWLSTVNDELRISVEATAFIRGMMRRIAGGLFEVGLGKRSERDFAILLNPRLRESVKWPVVLPARGLALISVHYGRELRDIRAEKGKKIYEEE